MLGIIVPVGLLIVVCRLVYCFMRQTYSYFRNIGLPGPEPIWVFGSVLEFKGKNPLDVFDDWKKKYGKVYGFYEGFKRCIVVNDPEIARQILVKQFDKFCIRTSYRPFLYAPENQNILWCPRQKWKLQRKIFVKALNSQTMKQIVVRIQSSMNRFIERLHQGEHRTRGSFEIWQRLEMFVADSMALALFDVDYDVNPKEVERLLEYTRAANWAACADNQLSGLARLFPSLAPFLQLFDTKHKELHYEQLEFFTKHIAELRSKDDITEMTSVLASIICTPVQEVDESNNIIKRKIRDDELLQQIFSTIGETTSTTSSVLAFTLYELALNQDVQNKLREEIQDCEVSNQYVDFTKILSIEYLDMVIHETIRHHPVAPGLQRTCAEDCNINGVRFDSGVIVRIMLSTLYNDEQYYPEPSKFIPERFSKEERQSRHQCSFIPFGLGPRSCPGVILASAITKIPIVQLLQRYQIDVTTDTEIPLKTTLRPALCPANGVHLKLTPLSV